MEKETRRFMMAIRKKLKDSKILDNADVGALFMLESAFDMYVLARKSVAENGILTDGRYGKIVSPSVLVCDKTQHQVLSYLKALGMTLKERQNIRLLQTPEEDSPLTKFFKEMDKRREEEEEKRKETAQMQDEDEEEENNNEDNEEENETENEI